MSDIMSGLLVMSERASMSEKETVKISKFLSLVLRHQPEVINISLDEHGWADVSELIRKCATKGYVFDIERLKHVVATNNKKRFAFNEDGTKIRASQGHSIEVDLEYKPQQPPEILYHGTGVQSAPSIYETGLSKRSRQHVHLSSDPETARKVGERHGKPIVFRIQSGRMAEHGFKFFLSDNGVWLTDNVPPEYIKLSTSVQREI